VSRIFLDERGYRLQVFTKLAFALIDLCHPLNQALAFLSQKCKFLLRERLDLLVRVSINDSHSQKPNWILQFKAGFPPWEENRP
jgi:hypothetical protein